MRERLTRSQVKRCLIDLEKVGKIAGQELVVTVKWVNIEIRDQNQNGRLEDTSINGLMFRDTSLTILTREGSRVPEA
jgi:hypothetical protein